MATSSNMQSYGRVSTTYGEFDQATDAATGTMVFVSGNSTGVAVVGRHRLDSSLTSPLESWSNRGTTDAYNGFTPAVALHDSTALFAWADVDAGIYAREVSLDTGATSDLVTIAQSGANIFKQLTAAWAVDRWVVIGQDYNDLIIAEIRNGVAMQRRLIPHTPAACAQTNSCGKSSSWRWNAAHLPPA